MLKIRANSKTEEIILPIGIYLRKQDERFDTCVVKAMDGDDEEAMSEKKIRNNGAKIVTALLAKKIIKVGDIDFPNGIGETIAREMFSEDRDTCLVAIRKLMKDEMEVNTKCPRCGDEYTGVVFMSELLNNCSKWGDNKEYHDESMEIGTVAFELPDGIIVEDDETGKELLCRKGILRMPTGVVEEGIAKSGMTNAGKANTLLLSACILELENIKKVDQYVVNAMTRVDREYLADVINNAKCGPKMTVDITCDNCDNDFKFMLQLPYFFYIWSKSDVIGDENYDEDFDPEFEPVGLPNLIKFFECSDKDTLNQECALLAERWNWTHEQIRALTTQQRRDYLEIVSDLYDKERQQMEKIKAKNSSHFRSHH